MANSENESIYLPKKNNSHEQNIKNSSKEFKKQNQKKKLISHNANQIMENLKKNSAPKYRKSVKKMEVKKFTRCELAKQCVATKVSVKLDKLSESEISKCEKGIVSLKTVKTPYNFVYTTTKMLDVQKIHVSKNLEKRPKEKKGYMIT